MPGFDELFDELKMEARRTQQASDYNDTPLQNAEDDDASLGPFSFGTFDSSGSGTTNRGTLTTAQNSITQNSTQDPPVGNFPFDFSFTDNNSEPVLIKQRNFKMELLGFVEEYWHANGCLPPPKELQLRFRGYNEAPQRLEHWPDILKEEYFKTRLEARGLPYEYQANHQLDPRFVTAVHMILNYVDSRSVTAKLKHCKITSAQWKAWLAKPNYKQYYREHAEAVFTDDMEIESKRVLGLAIVSGDLQAIKYYNEVTGFYRPQESATQNVIATLMTGLFEILARTVSAEVLNEIAAQIREAPSIVRVMGAIEAETNSDIKEITSG